MSTFNFAHQIQTVYLIKHHHLISNQTVTHPPKQDQLTNTTLNYPPHYLYTNTKNNLFQTTLEPKRVSKGVDTTTKRQIQIYSTIFLFVHKQSNLFYKIL